MEEESIEVLANEIMDDAQPLLKRYELQTLVQEPKNLSRSNIMIDLFQGDVKAFDEKVKVKVRGK